MNNIDLTREEILKELKRSITFYLDGYASYIREGAPCGLDEEQVLNLTAMEVDHILKDYSAIVEQQTKDAVIEEVENNLETLRNKISSIVRHAVESQMDWESYWSGQNDDAVDEILELFLSSLKSKYPIPEETGK